MIENKFNYRNNYNHYFENDLDAIIPLDHHIRIFDKYLDFTFINDLLKDVFTDEEHPTIDPILIYKIIYIGILFDYCCIMHTIEECNINLAYKWFLRLDINEKLPSFDEVDYNFSTYFVDTPFHDAIIYNVELQLGDKQLINEIEQLDQKPKCSRSQDV